MNMNELITTYNINNLDSATPQDRAEFYLEQVDNLHRGKKPTTAVAIVNIMLFNDHGEIFIQKRSDNKAHNAGLLDKTIGGHITYGDTVDFTVMVETVQELQVPSITLRTEKDFSKTYNLLNNYRNTVAIIKHIDSELYLLNKKIKGEDIPILNKVHLYFGIYNGAIKTVDREAKGVLLYSLEDLEKEIDAFPMIFSDDLKVLVKRYRNQISNFIKLIQVK